MTKKMINIFFCVFVFFCIISPMVSTKTLINTSIEKIYEMDYSNSIFMEFGTSTSCKNCKYAHAALKNIYSNVTYSMNYVTLLTDVTLGKKRLYQDYNILGFPTVFFSGGYKVILGANDVSSAQKNYERAIIECINREVPNLDINLSVLWIGNTTLDVYVSIQNNERNEYNGHIRVYITEKSSSIYYDTWNYPYTFTFLDYAFNENIQIKSGDVWSNSRIWNWNEHNFRFLTCNNIVLIAAVFNSEWHQGYANPPSNNPFDAYYVDKTAATSPPVFSNPPHKPNIEGSRIGKIGKNYNYTAITTDPEEKQIYYWFDWGDGTNSGWIGPYSSGFSVNVTHNWTTNGFYNVKVKAKDIYDVGSDWSDPLNIIIVKNKEINRALPRLNKQPRFSFMIRSLLEKS